MPASCNAACDLQGEAHGSRVSAEPLAASTSHLAQRAPVQSVFLYRQAQRVPYTEGGEARAGPHEASGSLLLMTCVCLMLLIMRWVLN